MFPPDIDKHVYDGQDYVWVNGVDTGATVKVFSGIQKSEVTFSKARGQSFGVVSSCLREGPEKDVKSYTRWRIRARIRANPRKRSPCRPCRPPFPTDCFSDSFEGGNLPICLGIASRQYRLKSGAGPMTWGRTDNLPFFFLIRPLSRPLKTSDAVATGGRPLWKAKRSPRRCCPLRFLSEGRPFCRVTTATPGSSRPCFLHECCGFAGVAPGSPL